MSVHVFWTVTEQFATKLGMLVQVYQLHVKGLGCCLKVKASKLQIMLVHLISTEPQKLHNQAWHVSASLKVKVTEGEGGDQQPSCRKPECPFECSTRRRNCDIILSVCHPVNIYTHTLHVPVYTIEFHMRIIFSCSIRSLIHKSQHNLFTIWQAAGFQRWILAFSETGAWYYVSALKKPTLGIFIPTTYKLCRKKWIAMRVKPSLELGCNFACFLPQKSGGL